MDVFLVAHFVIGAKILAVVEIILMIDCDSYADDTHCEPAAAGESPIDQRFEAASLQRPFIVVVTVKAFDDEAKQDAGQDGNNK